MIKLTCVYCGHQHSMDHKPGRSEVCQGCGRDLKICLNCRFYDPQAHHACREPQAEWVKDKERANFCDYFEPARTERKPESSSRVDAARAKLDKLFRGNDDHPD